MHVRPNVNERKIKIAADRYGVWLSIVKAIVAVRKTARMDHETYNSDIGRRRMDFYNNIISQSKFLHLHTQAHISHVMQATLIHLVQHEPPMKLELPGLQGLGLLQQVTKRLLLG